MKRLIKAILIISIFLPFALVQAQVGNLVVEFQQTPLFKEANFLPGEGVSRWVKVTNYSGSSQRIATQPLNITDPNHLGDVLNLEIKEAGVVRYSNALSSFFTGGENYLSDLANGATSQYDFTVSFYSGAQNTFQGKTLGFDILIGFQGTEGGILPGAGSTSGGGGPPGMLPPGLTIQNEAIAITTDTSVTIIWTTSYPATSQVIYALGSESHILDLTDRTGTPPKYGYARTTPEYDNFLKVVSHSVTIYGLNPGTNYYYRTVSHGSLAISAEHNFTTLTIEEAIAKAAETAAGETVSETAGTGVAEQPQTPEKGNIQGEVGTTTETGEKTASTGLAASILGVSGKWLFWTVLLLVVAIIAFLINRKKKENN